MISPRAVLALAKQQDRLTELLRLIDNGRWWTGDEASLIDEDEVCLQADRIGSALDVVERLANEMAAEDGMGTGSQLASRPGHALPRPTGLASGNEAVPEGLGPFSPGQVGPLHDLIHESGGYEQRAWGFSGSTAKLV
ncbi:hypothetical protein MKK69_21325 [Methylobacterium sp. J-026]|uniref:hypothetical protein n=1 Tax=Methylobacterium sp. J-026 TaxID=2836624 RepID=UPI001FBAF9DA|nr:hypothetical protein [Methylobacterium sp. J-026]MCJ2136560.1 hypothetical protein [Methylobacterium sp. J-026]